MTERRSTHDKRAAPEIRDHKICGYACVFDVEYDMGYFVERVRRGAFSKSLREMPDVLMLLDHDSSKPLARTGTPTEIGSLRIFEDSVGLRYEAVPLKTTYAADLALAIDAGVVRGSSMGFNVDTDDWSLSGGRSLRTLEEILLFEVSSVTFPASEKTSTELVARSAIQRAESMRVPSVADVEAARRAFQLRLSALAQTPDRMVELDLAELFRKPT
jgi:HK97 family phage prohead protease